MSTIDIQVPDIGDFDEVTVIELMVKIGDTVQVDQSLITVESDKASMEIPSSHAGVVKALKVQLGDKVKQGSVVLVLEAAGDAPGAAPAAASADTSAITAPAYGATLAPAPAIAGQPPLAGVLEPKVPSTPIERAQAAPVFVASAMPAAALPAHDPSALALKLPHASPSVRKFARELGVPLAEVKGSGLKGRITEADVQAFTKAVMAGSVQTQAIAAVGKAAPSGGGAGAELGLIPWPKVDFAKFGPVERKELGRIQKISGANLTRNAIMIPAVTNHDDADDLEEQGGDADGG